MLIKVKILFFVQTEVKITFFDIKVGCKIFYIDK
jgi:hypothetical protein